MATYKMDDGRVVSDDNAKQSWEEDAQWDGNNMISVATGSQWDHETLYCSRKGNYWLESTSQWQGSTPSARWVEPEEAAAWLLANNEELPADLAKAGAEVAE